VKLLIDMNLSPEWVGILHEAGWETVHWSSVGEAGAEDAQIMAWARGRGFVVFTHDLDFGTILALTKAEGPSVVQLRAQDITPTGSGPMVTNSLRRFEKELDKGALIVIDEARTRIRVLPLN
jgi:predicted nuclease of predicted toxin-antitoxin system